MTDVIKRDRRRQRYSRGKLQRSIAMATRDARVGRNNRRALVRDIARAVHERVSRRQTVRSAELRSEVLGRLATLERLGRDAGQTLRAWRRHDARRRR